jgi:dTMP kinase
MSGLMIAVDGVDHSGKTTFAKLIAQQLMEAYGAERVIEVQQPGATPIGAELRRIVKSKKYSIAAITERLIFAADAAEFYEYARREMEKGKVFVSDRYTAVTDIVYGTASGTPMPIIYDLHEWIQPVKADLLIVFKCPWSVAKNRVLPKSPFGTAQEDCRIEAKGDAFMERVSKVYDEITENNEFIHGRVENLSVNNVAHLRCSRVRCVDSSLSWEVVRQHVRDIVAGFLEDHEDGR